MFSNWAILHAVVTILNLSILEHNISRLLAFPLGHMTNQVFRLDTISLSTKRRTQSCSMHARTLSFCIGYMETSIFPKTWWIDNFKKTSSLQLIFNITSKWNMFLKATQFSKHKLKYLHEKTVTFPNNKCNHASKCTLIMWMCTM